MFFTSAHKTVLFFHLLSIYQVQISIRGEGEGGSSKTQTLCVGVFWKYAERRVFFGKNVMFPKTFKRSYFFQKTLYTLKKGQKHQNVSPFNRILLISSCSSDRFSDPAPNRVFCDMFLFACYEFGPRSSPGSRQYALVKGKEGRCCKVYSKKIQCECMICRCLPRKNYLQRP